MLQEKFNRVSKHLVGLWRFREQREETKWAATYFYKGKYHDIYPVKTIEKALDIVHKNLLSLRLKNAGGR